jgi:HAD superfamily hydrolase (TIGR01509 family)
MTLRALIFDVDGTLADTEEMHRRAFNAAFADQGLSWHWGRRVYHELLKIGGGRERVAHFIAQLRLSLDEERRLTARIPLIHRAKTDHYARLLTRGAALRPGIANLLVQARHAGMKLGIASTTTRANIDGLLESTLGGDAAGWFDAIATGDIVERKKPAPDVYERALSLLDVPPDACIAFEDSGIGLSAAKAAGLFTVVTPSEWTKDDDLTRADVLLDDLSGADDFEYLRLVHSVWSSRGAEAA